VATLRTVPRTITVPGADGTTELLSADALTNVTVAATHRRQGLLSRMLGASLAAARDRGDPVSILIAAEWPIYGRFGYAPAVLGTNFALYPRRAGGTVVGEPICVRQVDREAFGSLAPGVFAAARRLRAGQVDRDQPWWDRQLGLGGYPRDPKLSPNWLVHEGANGPDGLLEWTATRRFGLSPPLGAVKALGPYAANEIAYRDLWAYLSGLDGVEEIVLANRPADEPVRWLLGDARTLTLTGQSDFLWLRLLDVPAALAARRYASAGELVLEVVDGAEPSVAGRYRLSADGDGAQCEPTAADPDLTITQSALASAYLGGSPLRARAIDGAVTEERTGALTRADAMFGTPLMPWNATGF
jgi:predicted acetyltransferase